MSIQNEQFEETCLIMENSKVMKFFDYFKEKNTTKKLINNVNTAVPADFVALLNEVDRMMDRDDRQVSKFMRDICVRALELGDIDTYNQLLKNEYIPNKSALFVEIIEKAPEDKRLMLLQSLDKTNIKPLSAAPNLKSSSGEIFTISDAVYIMLLENNLIDINKKIYGSQSVTTRDFSRDYGYGSKDVSVPLLQDPLRICMSETKREALIKAGVNPNTPYPYLTEFTIANMADLEKYLKHKSYNDIMNAKKTIQHDDEMETL